MKIRCVVIATTLLLTAACSGTDDEGSSDPSRTAAVPATSAPSAAPTPAPVKPPPTVFPGTSWDRAEQGDWSTFDAGLARDGSTCVAVVKDGRLVHDAYWNGGTPTGQRRVYSIAKSLSSLLVGTLAHEGAVQLDASASEQIQEWRGTDAAAVTVRDLLSMTSGRRWSEAIDRRLIRGSADQTSYATQLAQDRPPGEEWVYDNAAAQTVESVLDDAGATDDVVEVAQDRLLEPLGMSDTTWGRDATGNALTYSGMESTCLDLARAGHLMLGQGEWEGDQLLSAGFVRQATTPSSTRNAAYGLMWWTNAQGRIVEVLRQAGFAADKAPYEGRLAPDVPADAFWAFGYGNQYVAVVPSEGVVAVAFGYGNQYVAVVPSEGVVAVRLGARPASPDRVTFNGFTADVLEVLGR